MCETMTDLNFQTLMNCDQLGLGSIDIEIGFQDFIPNMLQEASVVPDMATGLSFPIYHEHFNAISISDELKPNLCDLSNFHYAAHSLQQQQHFHQDWDSFSAPSSTTSPVQVDGMDLNTLPAGYEQQQVYSTTFVNGRKRKSDYQSRETTNHFNSSFEGGDAQNKPKRKRVQNARQRKAANVRERKRMFQLNEAFDGLKTRVPTFAYEKRLSRIETLKLAMTYISFMTQVLDGKKPDEISLGEDGLDSFSIEDLGRFKSEVSSSYVSDGTESSESDSISS